MRGVENSENCCGILNCSYLPSLLDCTRSVALVLVEAA